MNKNDILKDLAKNGSNRHFISRHVLDKTCKLCDAQATHKISEEIMGDDPTIYQRPVYEAYVCCEHFRLIMGNNVMCPEVLPEPEEKKSGFVKYGTSILQRLKPHGSFLRRYRDKL